VRRGAKVTNEIGDGVQKRDRDSLIFIQGNLAHALLFQGHYDEALIIYREKWKKPLNGRTFGEIILKDFATFDKAGLLYPDLSRMKRALARGVRFRDTQAHDGLATEGYCENDRFRNA
jgi:hypothetical protein